MDAERRRGFTLVELLVVIAIIGVLLLFFGPQAHEGRERARLTVCSNNATQIAKAMVNDATTGHGVFPGYMTAQKADADSGIPDEFPDTPATEIAIAWPARLLSQLDRYELGDRILTGKEDLDHPPPVEVFVCPSDPPVLVEYAALSYVVNSGMPDLVTPSEATPSDLKANGVCHDLRPGAYGPRLRSVDIRDGADSTILIAENVQRDTPQNEGERGNTWLRPMSGAKNVEQWYGMTWVYDAKDPLHPAHEMFEPFSGDGASSASVEKGYGAEGSRFARPASSHVGIFVAAHCSGSTRDIRSDIDYRVYQQLMTPDGYNAALINDAQTDMKVFMDPPVGNDEF